MCSLFPEGPWSVRRSWRKRVFMEVEWQLLLKTDCTLFAGSGLNLPSLSHSCALEVQLGEYNLDLIPFDDDLLSLELEGSFKELFLVCTTIMMFFLNFLSPWIMLLRCCRKEIGRHSFTLRDRWWSCRPSLESFPRFRAKEFAQGWLFFFSFFFFLFSFFLFFLLSSFFDFMSCFWFELQLITIYFPV